MPLLARVTSMPDGTGPYRIFFSHGGADAFMVREFFQPKLATTGATVFVDLEHVAFGDDFRMLILAELARTDELVVLLTPTALKRPWIFAEIGIALPRGIRIVAIKYGVEDAQLQRLGILSLLGTSNLLEIESFNTYLDQLAIRVKESNGND